MEKVENTLKMMIHARSYDVIVSLKNFSSDMKQLQSYLQVDDVKYFYDFSNFEFLFNFAVSWMDHNPYTRTLRLLTTIFIHHPKPGIVYARQCKEFINKTLEDTIETKNNKKITVIHEVLMITLEKMTPSSLKELQLAKCVKMTMFTRNELMVQLPLHECYQKTKALNAKEVNAFLKNRRTYHLDQLPILLLNDPTSKFFGFDIGTIVHIERKYGKGLQMCDYWRIVKPNPKFSFTDQLSTFAFQLFMVIVLSRFNIV